MALKRIKNSYDSGLAKRHVLTCWDRYDRARCICCRRQCEVLLGDADRLAGLTIEVGDVPHRDVSNDFSSVGVPVDERARGASGTPFSADKLPAKIGVGCVRGTLRAARRQSFCCH